MAYVTGKRVGSSVVRNKVRRRLRAIMAELGDELHAGAYLVRASQSTGKAKYDEMREDVWESLRSLGALRQVQQTFLDRDSSARESRACR